MLETSWADEEGDISAVGKGGGKFAKAGKGPMQQKWVWRPNQKGQFGKGGQKGGPQRYDCGQIGHIARNCPKGAKGGGKGNQKGGETRTCHNCGKQGHLIKDCRAMNIGAVEEEAQILGDSHMVEYVGWGGGVIGDIRSVEDEKPEWEPIGGKTIIEPILGDIDEVEGLEPTWRKRMAKGYKIKMVMDSGCITTIVPPKAIPGMKVAKTKDTGKNYRVANGELVPNEGATKLIGETINGDGMAITAQVVKVTKPLASANEIVDADHWIVMHKNGGIIKKLNEETQKEIVKIIESQKGSAVPIERENNQFVVEMIVPDQEESHGEAFELAKHTFKGKGVQKDQGAKDYRSPNSWESFWDGNDQGFHRQD